MFTCDGMLIGNFYNKTFIGLHTSSLNKIILVLASILFSNVFVHGLQKCYVCGPPESCEHFSENKEMYIKECPPDSKGCSIQINRTLTTRSCERNAFNDCKTANHVSYCYCHSDLCNDNISSKKAVSETAKNDIDDKANGDDEDDALPEGSGYQTISIWDYKPKSSTSTTQKPFVEANSSTNIIFRKDLLIILFCLLLFNS